uniref:Apple domain-containing protein n=1 Tax=Schistosoma mansoni TaxID=6183 RepID=A0A3Q0KKY6_SCHMA
MYSIQVILIFYSITLYIEAIHSDDELFAVNINGANTYSSSNVPGGLSEYSIDDDFMHMQPTCFQTDPAQPDLNGYHWLIIDFGIHLQHIKEIRLAPNPFHKYFATKLSNIDVFLIQSGESLETDEMLASLRQTNHRTSKQIMWNSKGIKFCQSTGNITAGTRAATIECPQEMDAKWLALRRTDELEICLISVYVKKAYEECFIQYSTEEQKIWPSLSGQPFSFIRHLSKSACRAGCSINKNCQAIRYRKIKHTGVCEQIRDVILSEDHTSVIPDERNPVLHDSLLNCEPENCMIELNKCHLGRLEELHQVRQSEENDTITSVSNLNNETNNLQSENKFSLWKIASNLQKTKADNSNESKSEFLYSIQMDGYLYCSKAVCDTLKIYSMDKNNEAILCGEIDSLIVSHLNKYYLFCQNNYPLDKLKFIRLEWNNMGREKAGYLYVNITQMFVRITKNTKLFNVTLNSNIIPMTTESNMIGTKNMQFVTEQQSNQHFVEVKEYDRNEQYTTEQYKEQFNELENEKEEDEVKEQHNLQETELLQQYYQHEKGELDEKRGSEKSETLYHKDPYTDEEEQYTEMEEASILNEENSHSANWLNTNTDYTENEEDEYDTSTLESFDDQTVEGDLTYATENESNIQMTHIHDKHNMPPKQNYLTVTTTESYEVVEHTETIDNVVTDSWALQPDSHKDLDKNVNNYRNKNITSTKLGVREVRREKDHDNLQITGQHHRNLEKKSLQTAQVHEPPKNNSSLSCRHQFILTFAITFLIFRKIW